MITRTNDGSRSHLRIDRRASGNLGRVIAILSAGALLFGGAAGARSLGPLKKEPPVKENPEFLVRAMGPAVGGFPTRLGERVEKFSQPDHWLVESSLNGNALYLVNLDRKSGESTIVRKIEAAAGWCYVPGEELLFAGRVVPYVPDTSSPFPDIGRFGPPEFIHECFDLATGQSLWQLPEDVKVMWAALSHDRKELLILQGTPGKNTGEGALYVRWHDLKTGKVTREVALPGTSKIYDNMSHGPAIADTPDITYVCRRSEDDAQCLKIPRGEDVAVPVIGNDEKFGPAMAILEPGSEWYVKCSSDFKWLVLHTSQELYVFRRQGAKLVQVRTVEAGDDRTIGDDISNVRFIPGTARLIVGSMLSTVIFDLAAGKIEKTLPTGAERSDLTEDKNFLVFWDNGGSWPISLRDGKSVRDGLPPKNMTGHSCPVTDVRFSASGKYVVSSDSSRYIVWDAASGAPLAALASPKEKDGKGVCLFPPSIVEKHGKVYGADGWSLLEWDLGEIAGAKGSPVLRGKTAFGDPGDKEGERKVVDLFIDPAAELIVQADFGQMLLRRFSAPGKGSQLKVKEDNYYVPRHFHFLPDQGKLVIFNSSASTEVDLEGKADPISMNNSAFLITPSGMVYDSGKDNPFKPSVSRSRIQQGGPGEVERIPLPEDPMVLQWGSADATDDNRLLIYQVDDQRILVVKCETGELVRTFRPPVRVMQLKVSPDGKILATAGHDRRIYLWSLDGL